MKRIATILVIGTVALAAIGAQPMMGRGFGPMGGAAATQTAPTASTIEGKLVFVDKYPAIQTKDKTYMLHMPQFFYNAYTDGIKEGATVKADGYVLQTLPGQDKPWVQATKIVINGKTYDFTNQPFAGHGMMGGMMGGNGGMMGGRGRGGRW